MEERRQSLCACGEVVTFDRVTSTYSRTSATSEGGRGHNNLWKRRLPSTLSHFERNMNVLIFLVSTPFSASFNVAKLSDNVQDEFLDLQNVSLHEVSFFFLRRIKFATELRVCSVCHHACIPHSSLRNYLIES